MLEDFLDHRLRIKITEYDIPSLHKLQEILNVRWAPDCLLDDEYIKELIKKYGTIYIKRVDSYVTYAKQAYGMPCVSVRTFIEDQKRIEVEEEDMMILLGE